VMPKELSDGQDKVTEDYPGFVVQTDESRGPSRTYVIRSVQFPAQESAMLSGFTVWMAVCVNHS
jgi:hypothetical protein